MSLVKPSTLGGGAFFKPGDRMNDLALLIEPKSIVRDVPNTYNGVTKNRDEVTADVTVFADSGALDSGTPSEIIKNCTFVHGMLTDSLSKILGQATIATVRKIPTKSGSGYVLRDPDTAATVAVTAYYEGRSAALEAAAASAPSFD